MGAIVQYYNLTGGINTVNGIGTINQTPRRTESPDMQNVEFYKLGGLKSMEGNTRFSKTVLTSSVVLGHEYIYEDRKYLLVFTTDGDIWEYDRVLDEFVSLNTRLGLGKDSTVGRKIFNIPTPRFSAVNFNNGVVFSNGVEDLVYYKKDRHILTTGKVNGNQGSKIISGDLTVFKTEIHKGDFIAFGYGSKEYYLVDEVTNDTSLIVTKELKSNIMNQDLYIGEISFCNASMINSTDITNEDETKDLIGTPVRGLALQSYQGRLWVGGTDGILYYSEVGLYNGWDIKYGAGNFPTFYNDTSAFSALALWDKVLVICKRERTYILDGTDSNDANWKIEPFGVNTVESQQSWIDCNNGLWGFSKRENGIYPILQRTIYNAYFGGNNLSLKISGLFDYINQAKYDEIFPVYHPKKSYIMFYIPLLTGIGSNDCFCYDTEAKAWLHRKVPQEVTSAFEFNNEVYIGTKDGRVLKEFSGLTFDGEPIEFYWKSPWFYFGDSTNNKTTKEFRVKISEENTNNFHIRNRRDGKDTANTRTIKSDLGAFIGLVWDIGYNADDFNEDYTPYQTVTKVKDNFNKVYYVEGNYPVASTIPINTALYKDIQCTDLAGYTGYLKDMVEIDNQEEADKIETLTKTYYSFTINVPKYFKWTNGEQTIWIDFWQRYPEANINCKYSGTNTTRIAKGVSFYTCTSFNLKRYAWINIPYTYNGTFVNKDNYPNLVKPDKGLPWNNWLYTSFSEGTNTPSNINNLDGFVGTYMGNIYSYKFDTTTKKIWYETTTSGTVANTPEEAGEATISTVVKNEDSTYTITLSDGTVLENLAAASYTQTIPITLYSKVKAYTADALLYLDQDCINEIGSWRNYTDSNGKKYNAYIPQNRYPMWLEKPTSYLSVYYKYYAYDDLTFTSEEVIENVPDPRRPVITVNDTGETITDTVWDNDSWVVSRQITKRFPLPNQYFETMQVEFYGNSVDEGMAIYGFEIDGVELEEVPFK